jgi:hypothetical protein
MKIIITENKLFNSITKYLENTYNSEDDLNWVYDELYDYVNDVYDDPINENIRLYFNGWLEGDHSNVIFAYYDKDYWDDAPSRAEAPKLVVMEYDELTEMFSEYWKEPMKKWFEEKFGLPVTSVTRDV